MNKLDSFAIITFMACDAVIENTENIRIYSSYFYSTLKNEAKDILKRLFR